MSIGKSYILIPISFQISNPFSHFHFHCYPGEALDDPISTGVCKEFNNVDSNNDRQIKKITVLKIESTVDIHYKNSGAKTCQSKST